MSQPDGRKEAGFSLVELMIAMVVTLVITGAMYALIASGQSGFKREPAVTDMQQNIRSAMALIQRDAANAGMLAPENFQAFAPTYSGDGLPVDAHGPNGTGLLTQADGVTIAQKSDWLIIWGNDGLCPASTACPPGNGTNTTSNGSALFTADILPACTLEPITGGGLVMLIGSISCDDGKGQPRCPCPDCTDTKNNPEFCVPLDTCTALGGDPTRCGKAVGPPPLGGSWSYVLMWAEPPAKAQTKACTGGNANGHVDFPHGKAPQLNPPGGPVICVNQLTNIQVVLYQIAPDADGVPSLWRSTGDFLVNSTIDKGTLVARGIEDLQVHYLEGKTTPPVWQDVPDLLNDPPPGPTEDVTRIVRQVRVTLSARTTGAPKLQGATTSAQAGTALRETMTTTITPRQALISAQHATLANGSPNPQWK